MTIVQCFCPQAWIEPDPAHTQTELDHFPAPPGYPAPSFSGLRSPVLRPLCLPFFLADYASSCRVNWFQTHPAKTTLCTSPWDQFTKPCNSTMAQLLNPVQGWVENPPEVSWISGMEIAINLKFKDGNSSFRQQPLATQNYMWNCTYYTDKFAHAVLSVESRTADTCIFLKAGIHKACEFSCYSQDPSHLCSLYL